MSTTSGTGVHEVEEVASGGLFTRKATGLVREVSPLSALIFNSLTSPAPFVLAVAIFYAYGAFPSANLFVAFIVGYGVSILFAFAIGAISSAMPRSGGDYVFVGRVIHPMVGLISSFCFTAGVLLSIAFFIQAVVDVAIAPTLTVMGLVGSSATLVDWGNTVATSDGWKFALGMVALLATCAMAAGGWRIALRIQNAGYALGMLSLIVVAIVLIFAGGDDFAGNFNQFANPLTGDDDSYNALIGAAREAGVDTSPDWTLSGTWPAIGAVMGFSMFTWYSVHIAGEVRQASTIRIPIMMVVAGFINLTLVLIFALLFLGAFGEDFFVAANALNGTDAYPFAAPPTYIFLTSIAGGSSFLGAFLGLSFMVIVLLMLWLNVVQPVRAMFAYAFDGVFPMRIAHVSKRSRVPIMAVGITFVISTVLYIWALSAESFFTVYATGVAFTVVALLLMAISATLLAYRRPDLWRHAAVRVRLMGVPLTTIAGIVAIGIAALMGYLFLKYEALGLTDPGAAIRNVAIVCVAAVVVYLVASAIRAREGLSLSKASSEIPPE